MSSPVAGLGLFFDRRERRLLFVASEPAGLGVASGVLSVRDQFPDVPVGITCSVEPDRHEERGGGDEEDGEPDQE